MSLVSIGVLLLLPLLYIYLIYFFKHTTDNMSMQGMEKIAYFYISPSH